MVPDDAGGLSSMSMWFFHNRIKMFPFHIYSQEHCKHYRSIDVDQNLIDITQKYKSASGLF